MVKKNGQREPFDRDKLARSITSRAAQAPGRTRARSSAWSTASCAAWKAWARARSRRRVIGELVMEALSSLDQVAYVRFASVYRNFREAKDFEEFDRRAREGGDIEGLSRDPPLNDHRHMRRARAGGAGSAAPGPIRPSAASSCARMGRVVGRGCARRRRAAACRDRGAGPGRRGGARAPRSMSRSSRARITARRRPAPRRWSRRASRASSPRWRIPIRA